MSIFKWIFENIAPGETDPAKRVDADRIMANFETLAAAHRPRAKGLYAVDGNANGSSTTTQCNITVKTDQGELGLLVLNDWVIVEDANSNVWNLQNTLANDELSFNVTHLISGSTPGDYSDAGFIDGLEIMINPGRMVLGKNQLGLSGSYAQKLTGSDIETSSADTAKIGTALPAVQTQVDVEHEAGGAHSAGVIAVENIAPDALLYENDANLVHGTMDYDDDKDGRSNGWEDYNTPTSVERSTTQVKEGVYSSKIVASQPSDGIKNRPAENPIDPDLFKGREIALAAWVYCATNNTVKLEIYDGVDTTTSAAGGTAGSWVRLYVSHTVNAAATEITPRIYTTQATTIYVDAVILCLGELAAGFTPHVNEEIYARLAAASFINYCPNPEFQDWSSGDSVMPDFWDGTGAVIKDTPPLFSNYCAGLTLDPGETFEMLINVFYHLSHFRERTVYFNAYVILDTATTVLRMQIDDGVGTSEEDVLPAGVWTRRGVKHTVDENATELTCRFVNNTGTQIQVRVDGVVVTVDNAPIGYKPAFYKTDTFIFGMAGTVTTGALGTVSGITTEVPMPHKSVVQSIYVKLGTAVGIGTTDTFTLYKNTVQDADYSIALTNTDDEGSDGVAADESTAFDPGDTLGVRVSVAGAQPGANAVAVISVLYEK